MDGGGAVALEKLRRFVDDWRSEVWRIAGIQDGNSVCLETGICDSGGELVSRDNAPLNKVLTVLAFNCAEIAKLRNEASSKIYPHLLVFGHTKHVPPEGEVHKAFAQSYPFFYELTACIANLKAVITNLVQQLQAIYAPDAKKKQVPSLLTTVHFVTAVSSLAEGITVFITLDEIVKQNGAISHALTLFLRLLQSGRVDPSQLEVEVDRIAFLEETLLQTEKIVSGDTFQDFTTEVLKTESSLLFLNELFFGIKDVTLRVMQCIDSDKEQPRDREMLVGLLGLFLLYTWMLGEAPDKKAFKLVMKLITKLPVLHLVSNVRVVCVEYLAAQLPPWARSSAAFKDIRKQAGALNQAYLEGLDDMLIRGAQATHRTVGNWIVAFNSLRSPAVHEISTFSLLGMHLKELVLGLSIANGLRCFVRSIVDLHVLLEVPLSKDQVRYLRHLIELLKSIRAVYCKRYPEVAQCIVHMLELVVSYFRTRLLQWKYELENDMSKSRISGLGLFTRSQSNSNVKDEQMHAAALVNLAIDLLSDLSHPQKRMTFRLAVDAIIGTQRLSIDNIAEIRNYISLIELAWDYPGLMDTATDCSFLYWNKEIMATCFATLYSQAEEARHIQHVISAFLDGVALLRSGNAEPAAIDFHENEIYACLVTELLEPLCNDIERDLRLHVHSAHLKESVTVNPTKTGVRDLSWFLNLKPLKLATKYIHIKSRVENYLNAAFYDHAAVALHNWKTYNEMKNLAEQKYGLSLDPIHLPRQTLEQGVDVLEIVRNMHTFVSCYSYNLNTQVFIEKSSNARNRKHLNTLSAKQISNSIRTHGTGIMSTAVNSAYQFLAQKFVVFSQFLFDDHIKSRLVKEQQFYKEMKKSVYSGYPVSRAEKLSKDIRKLGLTEDGSSFLDLFRRLITEMGNAVGFVRMVRLGGLHYCINAASYSPTVDYEQTAKHLRLNGRGVAAGRIADKVLETQNMSLEQADYFTILTNVFSQELQSSDNQHLQVFFLIVPAVATNAAELMLQSKEKLHKRGRDASKAMYTDDGFGLGVAYILKVLGQEKQFDSLHWFPAARKHFRTEEARLKEALNLDTESSHKPTEAQNTQVVLKRLTSYLADIELICFTLVGARAFFS